MEDISSNKKRKLPPEIKYSDSSSEESKKTKHKSKHKKNKSHKEKKKRKHEKKSKKHREKHQDSDKDSNVTFGPSIAELSSAQNDEHENKISQKKIMKPMTKEEWDKKQNMLQHVYDPETGRTRLIRGEGEIVEEIVSKDRQKEINKMATKNDGDTYATKLGIKR